MSTDPNEVYQQYFNRDFDPSKDGWNEMGEPEFPRATEATSSNIEQMSRDELIMLLMDTATILGVWKPANFTEMSDMELTMIVHQVRSYLI